ncbi:MAG: restriction system-associated AAA family ATPase [Desulfobacteraceae bacterium]|nr:restriction system-associated AAA family ATPase [Desulfobacteraceae bacterium]
MKLLRLKLNTPFRSLQPGFEVNFLREWDYDKASEFNPYCLVGRNGSGKSNILEVLSAIFYHIECIYLNYRPEGFEYDAELNPTGFRSEVSKPDAYELEYFYFIKWDEVDPVWEKIKAKDPDMPRIHISIIKEKGKPPEIHWLNRDDYQENKETKMSRGEVKVFLPRYILGYSSGHNEILSLPFFKMRFIHFDEYKDKLIKDDHYSQEPEGRMIYLDNQFNQAIVLCNFLFQPQQVLKPFEKELGITAIEQFRIIIRKHHHLEIHEELFHTLSDKEKQNETKTSKELTEKLRESIDSLDHCATTRFYDHETDSLYLDYWINDATKEAFRLYFGSALGLFHVFQILLTLNLYTVSDAAKKELYESESLYVDETVPTPPSDQRIMRFKDFVIKKKGVADVMYGKSLSDGEHQFLHAIGLCLLFKDQPSLFLLDEPETHFNPDWRAKLISSLRECLESDDSRSVMREMLIASHSPFIVSDCHEENVLVFKKDEKTSDISCTRPDFKTFGASVNQITIKAFEKIETIGGYAQNKLDELEKRFAQGEDAESLIKEANRILGDSVEKIIFINKLLDRK